MHRCKLQGYQTANRGEIYNKKACRHRLICVSSSLIYSNLKSDTSVTMTCLRAPVLLRQALHNPFSAGWASSIANIRFFWLAVATHVKTGIHLMH